jgi:hypothetical protein
MNQIIGRSRPERGLITLVVGQPTRHADFAESRRTLVIRKWSATSQKVARTGQGHTNHRLESSGSIIPVEVLFIVVTLARLSLAARVSAVHIGNLL